MSVYELFRRFFRPPGMRDPFFGGMMQEDEDEDDDFFFTGSQGLAPEPPSSRPPPLRDPFGFDDVFRDFNELFADFGAMIRDVPGLPGVEPPMRTPRASETGSLRDFMLKFPDSHLPNEQAPPAHDSRPRPLHPGWSAIWREDDAVPAPSGDPKQDKILDSEVSSRGLDSFLGPEELSPPSSTSYFRSVSVSRVMRADGTVEERRTVRDSDGNATTTVTVTGGDQVISDPPMDETLAPLRSLPDLSDSQTILSRILQRWFSS